jgi:hypothetical protein
MSHDLKRKRPPAYVGKVEFVDITLYHDKSAVKGKHRRKPADKPEIFSA